MNIKYRLILFLKWQMSQVNTMNVLDEISIKRTKEELCKIKKIKN